MKPVRVAAVQIGPDGVGPEQIEKLLASTGRVDLVLLPELCHLPYFPLEQNSDWTARAVALESSLVREVKSIAAASGCFIFLPLYLDDNGSFRNSVLLVGPDGELVLGHDLHGEPRAAYHKIHLCDIRFYGASIHESDYFVAGDSHVVWDTPFGRVGVLICYDRHFPEAWRSLRAAGAEIVCVPTASPATTDATFLAEMQAMALQQGLYVIVANRAGVESLPSSSLRTEWLGRSCVIGPDGSILALAPARQSGGVAVADLDPAILMRTRAGLPLAEHRRPTTYELEPHGGSASGAE